MTSRMEAIWIRVLRLLAMVSLAIALLAGLGSIKRIGHPFPGMVYGPNYLIWPLNASRWNGPAQGLTTDDFLLAANGHPLRASTDLDRIVRALPAGTPVTYHFLRNGKPLEATVKTQIFDMQAYAQSFMPCLVVGLLYLAMATTLFWLRPRRAASQAYLLCTAAAGLFMALTCDFEGTHWFSRLYLYVMFLCGAGTLHLALVFPDLKNCVRKRPWLPYIGYLPALLIASAWQFLFRAHGYAGDPAGAHGYLIFVALWALWSMACLLTLFGSLLHTALNATAGPLRSQARFCLLGALAGYVPGISTLLVPMVLGSVQWIPGSWIVVSAYCFLFFPASIAYAIIRHQMFDISLIIKRTLVYMAIAILLTGLYLFTFIAVSSWLAPSLGMGGNTAGHLLATALVAILFTPLRDRLRTVIDRWFFRPDYDFQEVSTAFAEQARSTLQPDQLLTIFFAQITAALHPDYLLVLTQQQGALVSRAGAGRAAELSLHLPSDHPALHAMKGVKDAETSQPGDHGPLLDALCFPLALQEELIGCVLVGPRKSGQAYSMADRRLLFNLTQQLAVWLKSAQLYEQASVRAAEFMELMSLYEQASHEALTDSLTGLYNRRAFQDQIQRDVAEATRYKRPLSLLILDIDHFKRFNDDFGHAMGDRVLRMVADLLRTSVRLSDLLARWGGEEFIVALPDTDLPGARLVAERIRDSIEKAPITGAPIDRPLAVTVSLGISTLGSADSIELLLARADEALYEAKARGRNRVQSGQEKESTHPAAAT